MADRYTRITVPLSQEEFEALRESAQQNYRHPREQARFLLRNLLLGLNNSKSAVQVSQTTTGAFAGVNP